MSHSMTLRAKRATYIFKLKMYFNFRTKNQHYNFKGAVFGMKIKMRHFV